MINSWINIYHFIVPADLDSSETLIMYKQKEPGRLNFMVTVHSEITCDKVWNTELKYWFGEKSWSDWPGSLNQHWNDDLLQATHIMKVLFCFVF